MASSSWGSTPTARTRPLAMAFRARMNGRNNRANARNGRASRSAESSGWAIAQDFGAISPTTMWRNTTTLRAMAKAMAWRTPEGMAMPPMADSSSPARAGSAMMPSPSEHIVMPSCAPASISESSRMPARAERAALLPSAASCSIRERREARRANSAATKNPLSARSTTAIAERGPGVHRRSPSGSTSIDVGDGRLLVAGRRVAVVADRRRRRRPDRRRSS
jgi:hypothetical protein